MLGLRTGGRFTGAEGESRRGQGLEVAAIDVHVVANLGGGDVHSLGDLAAVPAVEKEAEEAAVGAAHLGSPYCDG
jgi:hypothetical protein